MDLASLQRADAAAEEKPPERTVARAWPQRAGALGDSVSLVSPQRAQPHDVETTAARAYHTLPAYRTAADASPPPGAASTYLRHAAGAGADAEVARFLEAPGCAIDARGALGDAALHWAAENGHDRTVRLLVARGCDVDAQDKAVSYTHLTLPTILLV